MYSSVRITRLDVAWYRETLGYYLGFVADDSDVFWEVVEEVKALPQQARRWEPDAPGGRAWWILATHISLLYPVFPGLQQRVASLGARRWENTSQRPPQRAQAIPPQVAEAFKALYLTTNAPLTIVTAAYRALAKVTHPDAGGSTQAMQRVNAAYEIAAEWAKDTTTTQ